MIDRLEPRVFYGWWVALAIAIIIFLSTGIRFAVGPFLKPMAADLGLDRGSFSLVIAISLFLCGAVMPLVGALVDRIGSRVVCAAGGCLVAASLELSSRMTSCAEFVLYYGVVASLGLAATGHVIASATLTRWFTRRRATAMSLVGAAGMAGGRSPSACSPTAWAGGRCWARSTSCGPPGLARSSSPRTRPSSCSPRLWAVWRCLAASP